MMFNLPTELRALIFYMSRKLGHKEYIAKHLMSKIRSQQTDEIIDMYRQKRYVSIDIGPYKLKLCSIQEHDISYEFITWDFTHNGRTIWGYTKEITRTFNIEVMYGGSLFGGLVTGTFDALKDTQLYDPQICTGLFPELKQIPCR